MDGSHSGAALAVEDLTKSYGAHPDTRRLVLKDVDLVLEAGQTAAVIGPSGSGKTTLLNCIGLLDPPDRGTIRISGVEVSSLSPAEALRFRGEHIGLVFQEHRLLPQCTVLENVLIPAVPLSAAVRRQLKDRATMLLERVGLESRATEFPDRLSGGERQRVAAARALIRSPALLLCDEPTGNLDPETADAVVRLFLELAAETSAALLMVTHNHAIAGQMDAGYEVLGRRLRPWPRGEDH